MNSSFQMMITLSMNVSILVWTMLSECCGWWLSSELSRVSSLTPRDDINSLVTPPLIQSCPSNHSDHLLCAHKNFSEYQLILFFVHLILQIIFLSLQRHHMQHPFSPTNTWTALDRVHPQFHHPCNHCQWLVLQW